MQQTKKHDKLDLVASAAEINECTLKTEQNHVHVNVLFFKEHSKLLLESLILAQDERWRRA